jgi:hypothetical protein
MYAKVHSSFVSVCVYRTGEKRPPADERMVGVTPG